jgi:hypothetical protein
MAILNYSMENPVSNMLNAAGSFQQLQAGNQQMNRLAAADNAASLEARRIQQIREDLSNLDTKDPAAVKAFMQQNPEYIKDIGSIVNYGDAKQRELIGREAVKMDQLLSAGDNEAVIAMLERNRGMIDSSGDPAFNTDAAIQMLNQDPEGFRDLVRGTAMASMGTADYLKGTETQSTAPEYENVQFDEQGNPFGINKATGQYEQVQGGFQRAKPAAQTVVNVDKGEGEQQKAIGKAEGEIYNTIQKASFDSRKTDATLGRLSQLSDKAFDGVTAGAYKGAAKLAEAVGIKVEGLTETELFTALSNDLVLGQTNQLTGVLTDRDMSFLEQTVPQLSQTKEGRKQLIGIMKEVNEASREKAKLAKQFKDMNDGYFDSAAFDEFMANRKPKDRFAKTLSAPAQGAIVQGYEFLGGDPANQSNWRKR